MDLESSTERAHDQIVKAALEAESDPIAREAVPHKWLKIAGLSAAIVLIFVWQRTMPIEQWTLQDVLQTVYYLPCLVAATFFGVWGGLIASIAASGFTVYHVIASMGGDFFGSCLCRTFHIFMLIGTSVGAGLLFDASAKARRRAEVSRDRLRGANDTLLSTSRKLSNSLGQLREATMRNAKTEEYLRRAERLNALGKLTAGLAHEIRNPLASIRGSAEILRDRSGENDTVREFIDIIDQEAERLDEVLSRFLTFAQSNKLESGAAPVGEIIAEVATLLERQIEKRGIALDVDIASELPRARVLPIHLRQVMLNLMLNAVQALEDFEGRRAILVVARTARSSSKGGDSEVEIVVADSGPGVPVARRCEIFDPFYTTKDAGTGLGLAMVDRIVRDSGGSIRYLTPDERASDLPGLALSDSGACFVIELPGVAGER